MIDELVTLSADQRVALQIALKVFRVLGEWPSVQHVDRELDRLGLASEEVLASLPENVARVDRYVTDGRVALTLLGLAQCEGADRELGLFLFALRSFAEKERTFMPASPTETETIEVTSAQLAAQAGSPLTRADLLQVLDLFQREGLTAGSNGPGEDEPIWTIRIDKRIRPYRAVKDIDDYLSIKYRPAVKQSAPAAVPAELCETWMQAPWRCRPPRPSPRRSRPLVAA